MSALLEQETQMYCVLDSITDHPAWLDHVSGLKADKMLRGKKTFQYVLRAGEFDQEYYVSFVGEDGSIRHVPFVISVKPEGWYYENAAGSGPYKEEPIDHVLHRIMHCEEGQNTPLISYRAN